MEPMPHHTVLINTIEDITREDASFISWQVGKAFVDSESEYQLLSDEAWEEYRSNHTNTTYLIIRNEKNEILGFEEIYELNNITLDDQTFNVLGTGSLIAVKQGMGIGRAIVKKLQDFLNSQGKSALGFCEDESLEFHRKMGREVWLDGGKKLICNGDVSTSHLIVHRGKDRFIEKLEQSEQQAIVPYEFW